MLTYLELKNYIFIKELKLEFNPNFNIFTGETGAGKSIIIEAISLLCGEKQKVPVVGNFSDKCEITGLFEIKPKIKEEISEVFDEVGIQIEDELIVRREIDKQNKSRFFLNDNLVSLSLVKKIFDTILDIHGQNEHQKLLSSTHQLSALDRYAELDKEVKNFKNIYSQYKKNLSIIENLKNEVAYTKQKLDLINYQISEIEQAKLSEEDEHIEEELEKAKNAKKVLDLLSEIKFNLTEIKQKNLNLEKLYQTLKSYIKDIDEKGIYKIDSEIENLLSQTEEYKKNFSNYTLEYIDSLVDRVDLIKKLKRKYGNTIQEIKNFHEELKKQLKQINLTTTQLDELESQTEDLKQQLLKIAQDISSKRKKAAQKLQQEINKELSSLGLQKAKLEIQIETAQPTPENLSFTGLDKVEFFISTNPGSPFLPLKDVASGGELSRIMLAIKTVLGRKEETPILIFDEIDAGVGGPMGFTIGKKLKQLSLQNKQIFCITHLPQIACFADRHFLVRKEQTKQETKTTVEVLENENQIEEIARMLSGAKVDETSLKHAKNLIKEAKDSINE